MNSNAKLRYWNVDSKVHISWLGKLYYTLHFNKYMITEANLGFEFLHQWPLTRERFEGLQQGSKQKRRRDWRTFYVLKVLCWDVSCLKAHFRLLNSLEYNWFYAFACATLRISEIVQPGSGEQDLEIFCQHQIFLNPKRKTLALWHVTLIRDSFRKVPNRWEGICVNFIVHFNIVWVCDYLKRIHSFSIMWRTHVYFNGE